MRKREIFFFANKREPRGAMIAIEIKIARSAAAAGDSFFSTSERKRK